ncbi:MAG: hypothetical protein ACI8WT_000686 [Clostridium sp.]|jgi:hypothetical protein
MAQKGEFYMSKKRCCENSCGVRPVNSCGVQSLCSNPICAIIALIILQRTCLLEDKNAFLLILIFIGYCCCKRPAIAPVGCGC